MIEHRITDKGIVVIEPISSLSSEDFRNLSETVDAYLAEHPTVRGLLIHSKEFPGWESFAGLTAHIRFIRDHHQQVERVALVTDSSLGSIAKTLAKHFVAAEIRHYPYADLDDAEDWLESE
ncbi:MAG: STAS/SEC14 domain-containing protein [Pirellulales bacterium]|nr:STAS/SEC14 domain-containing protein [Pirellulales bacterium]